MIQQTSVLPRAFGARNDVIAKRLADKAIQFG
jgi:hypothetical protein